MAYHHELNSVPNEFKLIASIVRRTTSADVALSLIFDSIVFSLMNEVHHGLNRRTTVYEFATT